MKILFPILFVTLMSSLSPAPSAPVAWENEQLYDFGDIEHEKEVNAVFKFRNLGTDSLFIDNVRTSCGCTSPNWSAVAVAPDSIGLIHITYDAEDMGFFSKWIKVYFKGYRKAERLDIEGYVVGQKN